MQTKTFTLQDGEGRQHEYEVQLHPPTEGMEIMWQLIALGAGPLGSAIKGFLTNAAGGGTFSLRGMMDDPEGLSKLAGAVDFAAVGNDIAAAVMKANRAALVRAILCKTSRDGKRLESVLAFDEAFVGNYGELIRAIWEVVRANRFLSLLNT